MNLMKHTSMIFLIVAPCFPIILPIKLLCAKIFSEISVGFPTFFASSSITSKILLHAAVQFSGCPYTVMAFSKLAECSSFL